ncbi:NlpC/P60 family protein [Streptomyces sp. TRM 70351]|uniref:NlpC/P60 family protein n=1 Tax=Streptomyces sp. TRM 70351 TaxID=3116552 RepID=UPI002E7C44A5|nr:NlpC/P60 family protein [Streptomyces sp. TRM 70351]MEE1927523.1 NlpC/P60 family protein [Streptomyces sp. TRM 70351]
MHRPSRSLTTLTPTLPAAPLARAGAGFLLAAALSVAGTGLATATPLPSAASAQTAAAQCQPLQSGASQQAEAIVRAACSQLGVPYSWGGGSIHGPTYGQDYPGGGPGGNDSQVKGFDCSHLVQYAAWQGARILLPEGSWNQAQWSGAVARFGRSQGTAPLLPGDLLFWGKDPRNLGSVHHIAVYLGNGKMVEARESGTRIMVSDVRLNAEYAGALRLTDSDTPPDEGGQRFTTWGTGVRVRAEARLNASTVHTLAGPTAVRVTCQKRGDLVRAEGYENDAWSYLPDFGGYISNIYIDHSAAWLPGVRTC